MSQESIYQNGEAEALLLRAMRPFATTLAFAIWAYAAFGMPWLDVASTEFVEPFRQIIRVLCIGAVGMLMAVWIGGQSARSGGTPSRIWCFTQIASSTGLLLVGVILFAAAMH